MARGPDTADGVLEQRVAAEHLRLPGQHRDHPARVAGGVQHPQPQAADRQLLAVLDRPGDAVHQVALGGVDQHLRVREAAAHGLQLGHVIVVVMGDQHVGDADGVLLGRVQQRPNRAPGVEEEAVAAGLGGDEIGVGQPVRVHRALDDHRPKP